MPPIVDIVLPIFALMAVGYHAGRARVLSNTMVQGLSRFVTHYALPALLFTSVARAGFPERIEWGFLLSFYLSSLAVLLLGAAGWLAVTRRPAELATTGLAACYANIGAIGVPLVLGVYGAAGVMPVTLLLTLQSPFLITVATVLAELGRADGRRLAAAIGAVILGTVSSPAVVAIALGLAVNVWAVPLPAVVETTAGLIGQALLPCSSFAIGASFALGPVRGRFAPAAVLTALKIGVHPALTWVLATQVFALPQPWAGIAVTMAALPVGMTAYLFAERHNLAHGPVALALLLSTVCSPVSITLAGYLAGG